MFGRGVIATQYGWALEKAGNSVDFYVRPGRSTEYGPYVKLDILDGRSNSKGIRVTEKWAINMLEEISPKHDYDIIIISVNHNQLEDAIKTVSPWVGKATILMFNNIWEDMQTATALLPQKQIIWGFPGGGGGFKGNILKAGFVKSIFLESASSAASSKRYQRVVSLFQKSGFSISVQKDMRSWYMEHFIMNAAMSAQAFKAGSYKKLYTSPKTVKPAVLLMRELIPLIQARGGKLLMTSKLMMYMPAGLIAYGTYKLITDGIMGAIMQRAESSSYISQETLAYFAKDILITSRELGINLPHLEALEPYFKNI